MGCGVSRRNGIQLAVITGIVLTNQSSGDVVTVNYTNPNTAADSLTLHL